MVLIGGPIGVEFVAYLPVLLFLGCFLHEWVLQELRPGETLAWSLVEQALEEGLEFGGHVVGEFDGVFDNQVDQRVDTVRVKRRGPHE